METILVKLLIKKQLTDGQKPKIIGNFYRFFRNETNPDHQFLKELFSKELTDWIDSRIKNNQSCDIMAEMRRLQDE